MLWSDECTAFFYEQIDNVILLKQFKQSLGVHSAYSDLHCEPNTYEVHTHMFLNIIGFSVSPLLSAVIRAGMCSDSDILVVN